MGVVDKLNQIKSCKEDIKQAIIDKGVDMTDVAFTEYATKIGEIQAGGGDYLDMRMNMSTYYSTVEKVDNYTFAYCSSLKSVNLPMCSYVGSSAFQNCPSLTSVNIPMCVSVGAAVFCSCSSLLSVNIPELLSTTTSMFENCKSLQSVDLPMCERIGDCFNNCSSLTSVNIPKCLRIDGYTFSGCIKLPSLYIPFCQYISGNQVFKNCLSLSVLDLRSTYSCVLSNSNTFSSTPFASGVGSIYVHAAHLSQFQNATNWTYFSKCFVGVGDPDKPLLAFDNGRVYGDTYYLYSDNWKSYLGITSGSIISIDLPNCSYMSDYIFSYYSSLQTVNLPMCVSVGISTFAYCSSLTSVNLPMCSYVGKYAFTDCSSLTSVNLPMCSYVGISAFQGCSSLQTVNLPMCSYVGSSAFQGCSSLQTVNLPMCEYIGGTAFYTYNNTIDTLYIGTSISKVCQAGGGQIFATNNNVQGVEYFVNKIFVPMSLVDAYKSAEYWSYYASYIFGI